MKKNKKIFHGTENICGIGRYLSDWQRKKGAVSDFITYSENKISLPSHFNVQLDKYPKNKRFLVKLFLFFLCLVKYDIFHFYFGNTFLPYQLDLPILKLFNKKIIMTYCGSDIRLIEVEKQRNPYWKLLTISQNNPRYDRKKKWKMRWHKCWVGKIIAPRNLYASVSQIYPASKIEKNLWIHNLINLKVYQPNYFSNPIPFVVHAPSESGIKGSIYVEKAIKELKNKGYKFSYQKIEDMPHDEAIGIYKKADIILDQFLLGGFGSLAAEGMAMGKPVVAYIIESVKQEHFPDCPIVNSTIDNLEVILANLINQPDKCVEIGRQGRKFVEKYLDSDLVNQKLWDLYNLL